MVAHDYGAYRHQEWHDCERCYTGFPERMLTAYEWLVGPQVELSWFCDDCEAYAQGNADLWKVEY